MQDHQKEIKSGHQEIKPRHHTRNDRDVRKPEVSSKNAAARPKQTDYTYRQTD